MPKLHFFYSAMNAGKTTSLLQSAHNYRQRGMHVVLYTPECNSRDGDGVIRSRIGLQQSANILGADDDLFAEVKRNHEERPTHCVFIDEAQFLTPHQVLQATRICDELGIPVCAYGLRTDFRGEPFEGSKYLLAWSEELIEVKTICSSGRKATMSARLDHRGERVWEGDQLDVGYHYVPMSRSTFDLPLVWEDRE